MYCIDTHYEYLNFLIYVLLVPVFSTIADEESLSNSQTLAITDLQPLYPFTILTSTLVCEKDKNPAT